MTEVENRPAEIDILSLLTDADSLERFRRDWEKGGWLDH